MCWMSRHSSRSLSLNTFIIEERLCIQERSVKFISGSRGEPKNQLLLSWIISWATNTHSCTHTHTHAHIGEVVVMNGQVTWSAFGASPRHNKPLWAKPPGKKRLQRERWRTREREEERRRAGEMARRGRGYLWACNIVFYNVWTQGGQTELQGHLKCTNTEAEGCEMWTKVYGRSAKNRNAGASDWPLKDMLASHSHSGRTCCLSFPTICGWSVLRILHSE